MQRVCIRMTIAAQEAGEEALGRVGARHGSGAAGTSLCFVGRGPLGEEQDSADQPPPLAGPLEGGREAQALHSGSRS